MKKISWKFNFLLILSVAVSVIVSSLATTSYLLVTSEKQMHERDIIHIKGLTDNIQTFLQHADSLNYQLSIHPEVAASIKDADPDWEQRRRQYADTYTTAGDLGAGSGYPLLVKMQQLYPFVELIFVQDGSGNQTIRSFGEIGQRGNRWWFKKFMEDPDHSPFISKSYYSLTGNIPVASVFHPVFEGQELIGIIGTDINFQRLQDIVEGYLKADDMYAIVLDSEGVIIAHPDRKKIAELYNLVSLTRHVLKNDETDSAQNAAGYHETTEENLDWPAEVSEAASAAISGECGFIKDVKVEGLESTVLYEPIKLNGSNFAVLLVHDTSGIVRTKWIIFSATAVFIVGLIVVLFLLFRSRFKVFIIDPLQILIDSMKNLDLDHFEPVQLRRNDELSILINTYNSLVGRLSEANSQLHEKIVKLQESESGYKAFADIGVVLSVEKDIDGLLELILEDARVLSRADGGTLYVYDPEKKELQFKIIQNETMNIRQGGKSGSPCDFPPVPLYVKGEPNHTNVSSHSALTGNLINIPDVYHAEGFDFAGMREYDKRNNYHSQSMLVIPMKNRNSELIGVIQLINSRTKDFSEVCSFPGEFEQLLTSLAAQAAVCLTNTQLSNTLENLLYSFIEGIASAVDAKSPYTGGHINRVVTLTMMIADEINRETTGAFKDTFFSDSELEELKLAALMHDIGKVSIPESIMDKSSRLQMVMDRIDLVEMRFALIREKMIQSGNEESLSELETDLEFIRTCNHASTVLKYEDIQRLKEIASKTYTHSEKSYPYLADDELEDLCIPSGTLNSRERKVMENHVSITKKILDPLPFPAHLANISRYAAMHHEKINGSGYPAGLSDENIPLQSRIIAISDIFEALTARDRPYREPLRFSEAMEILAAMRSARHIDPDIYEIVAERGVGQKYEEKELT